MTIAIYSDYVPELTLADRIHVGMRHAGVKSAELADYCGVHPTMVSKWLANTNKPKMGTLRLIAQRYDSIASTQIYTQVSDRRRRDGIARLNIAA